MIFDPDTGKLLPDVDLKSIQFSPAGRTLAKEKVDKATDTKYVQILDDRDGSQAGAQREYASGRIDAIATPNIVKTKVEG